MPFTFLLHSSKISFLILILYFFFQIGVFGQANNLLKKYDASFENITLDEAFRQLTSKSGCHFSFNASILPLDRIINQKYHNKTLLFILTSLLSEYDVGFKEVKNQIIIYQLVEVNNGKSSKNFAVSSTKKGGEIYHIINIYDTIRKTIIDTFEIADTVRVYDTIRIVDKQIPQKSANSNKNKSPYFSYDIGTAIQYNFFELGSNKENYASLKRIEKIKKPEIGFSFGSSFTFHYKKFLIESGIFYNLKKEKYRYTDKYLIFEKVNKDSVRYINIITTGPLSDTFNFNSISDIQNKYQVYESEIIQFFNVDYQLYTNIHYLQVPLLIGYKKASNKDIVEFKGGIYSDFFLLATGNGLFSKDTKYSQNAKKNNRIYNPVNFSLFLDFSYNFYINKKTFFIMEFYYYQNLNSIYNKSYWYSQLFSSPGLKFGLRKILN